MWCSDLDESDLEGRIWLRGEWDMVLIEVRGSDGELIGRCDASCYGAIGEVCLCVCGGLSHGKGLLRALESVAGKLGEVVEVLREKNLGSGGVVAVVPLPLKFECPTDSA